MSTGILTGTYKRPDGTARTGTVTITPSVAVVRNSAGNIILAGPVSADLDASGSFTVTLAASNDSALDPAGVTYKVTGHGALRGIPPVAGIAVPAGQTIDMADVTPVDPAAPTYAPWVYGTGGTGLATVATTGAYSDLTGKPTIPSIAGLATTTDVTNASAADRARANHTGSDGFTGYDVFCVAGQSNASDFGIGVDAIYLDGAEPRIKQYALSGIYAGQIVAAIPPLLSRIPQGSDRIGFAQTFAKDYLDFRASPDRKVLIVPCAVGGTGFTSSSLASPPGGYYTAQDGALSGSWDPAKGDGGFSLYQEAIDKTNAAIASMSGSRLVGVLWLQGEGDSSLSQSAYAAKLDALIDGFRANMTGGSTVPFVLGQMVPDWVSFNPTINAAHAGTPGRKTRTAFAFGTSGMSNPGEPYHYNAAGQRAMGHSLYTAFATI